jgi:plasmid stabilization system protein ParE
MLSSKNMLVRWRRGALRNLDQEASYIAPDNPKAAAELVRHLRDSALLLGEQPNLGRPGRIPGTERTRSVKLSLYFALSGSQRYRRDTARISHGQTAASKGECAWIRKCENSKLT